jgi:hypothetical protein
VVVVSVEPVATEVVVAGSFAGLPVVVAMSAPEPHPATSTARTRTSHVQPRWRRWCP